MRTRSDLTHLPDSQPCKCYSWTSCNFYSLDIVQASYKSMSSDCSYSFKLYYSVIIKTKLRAITLKFHSAFMRLVSCGNIQYIQFSSSKTSPLERHNKVQLLMFKKTIANRIKRAQYDKKFSAKNCYAFFL